VTAGPVLAVQGLSVATGSYQLVEDVSFALAPGSGSASSASPAPASR
jgi:ABC-type phosphonate transport system ATPase subunit